MAASGAVAIGYEVLWFRMLRYFAAHTVYTFSTFLSVYLLGLVLGSAICARWLSKDKSELSAHFARVQIVIGILGLVSFALLGRARNLLLLTSEYSPLSPSSLGAVVLLAIVVLLPPTTLIGMALPLASELAIESVRQVGARLGLLYGANTLGGVLGSIVTGFLLLPWLGAQRSFEILIAMNFALFLAAVLADPALRVRRDLWRLFGLSLATALVERLILGSSYLADSQRDFLGGEVLDFRETEDATFVVMGYDDPKGGPYQQIIVNGTSYANNAPLGRLYMALLGHLPALLHDSPQSAVVICVGTGTTIGAVSLHPEIERVYAVDLTRHIFDLAPHFVPLNHRFFEDERVRKVAADGRHFCSSQTSASMC